MKGSSPLSELESLGSGARLSAFFCDGPGPWAHGSCSRAQFRQSSVRGVRGSVSENRSRRAPRSVAHAREGGGPPGNARNAPPCPRAAFSRGLALRSEPAPFERGSQALGWSEVGRRSLPVGHSILDGEHHAENARVLLLLLDIQGRSPARRRSRCHCAPSEARASVHGGLAAASEPYGSG